MKNIMFINISLLLWQLNSRIYAETIDVVEIVKSINDDPNLPWKADTYGYEKLDEDMLEARLGAKIKSANAPPYVDPSVIMKLAAAPVTPPDADRDRLGLLVNFTWTDTNVTKCPISHIRDQSNCGSCWAVSTVSALGDRFCIKTNGKDSEQLSENFVTACDTENRGCRGGTMESVNNFMKTTGTITGGDYESDKGCQTFTVRPCGYPLIERMYCDYNTAINPKCQKQKCNNDWYSHAVEPESNVHKAKSWYMVRSNFTHSREDRIREEIANNGPVTATFMVPRDFYFYKKGVYIPKRRWGGVGHAVRVVGWGVENGLKYWHAANSWTSKWGEQGFFKIIRGVNILDFENFVSALEPKL